VAREATVRRAEHAACALDGEKPIVEAIGQSSRARAREIGEHVGGAELSGSLAKRLQALGRGAQGGGHRGGNGSSSRVPPAAGARPQSHDRGGANSGVVGDRGTSRAAGRATATSNATLRHHLGSRRPIARRIHFEESSP
jgi:hypothetical protein